MFRTPSFPSWIAALSVAAALLAAAVPAGAQSRPASVPALATGEDPASPQAVPVTEYLGGGYMTFGDACARQGWSGTQQIMVRAQPQGLRGNPRSETQLAIYFATGTIALRYDLNGSRRYVDVDQVTYVWNGPWTPQFPKLRIAYDAYYGDFLTSGDRDLQSVNILLGNFNEIDGCNAEMRVSLGRM